MSSDRRRLLFAIARPALGVFVLSLATGWMSDALHVSYLEGMRDSYGEYMPVSDWGLPQLLLSVVVLLTGWVYGLLTLPGRAVLAALRAGDSFAPWSLEWAALLAANSLGWALLYSVWSGIRGVKRRRQET